MAKIKTIKRKAPKRDWYLISKLINKVLFVIIFTCGVYYVASINDLSIKGFVLQELKLKQTELLELNNDTKLMAMELESYDNISKRAEELGMVKVDRINYLSAKEDAVAKK